MEHPIQQALEEIRLQGIVQEINSMSFIELCTLLPEDVCWGDSLMPSLLREILIAFVSKKAE